MIDLKISLCIYCKNILKESYNKNKQAHFDCYKAVHGFIPNVPLKEQIELLLQNIDKIPANKWDKLEHYPDKKVIWFLDRDIGTEEYTFEIERFGITYDQKIVWGFDSGCSCPTPFGEKDTDPDVYKIVKTWKEFIINNVNKDSWFDLEWEEESMNNIALILAESGILKS